MSWPGAPGMPPYGAPYGYAPPMGYPPRGMPPPMGMPPMGMPPPMGMAVPRGMPPPIPMAGMPPPIPAAGMPPPMNGAPRGPLVAPPRGLPSNLPALSILDQPQAPVKAYVGKLPEGIDDSIVQTMLRACGQVNSWKRAADAETGSFKRFGHVEFAHPRAALLALKHLDGLEVDGSTMMVKVPSATSKRLEEYKAALDERHKQQLEEAKRQAQTRAAVAAVQKLQGGSAPVDEPGEVPEKVLAPFEQEEVACTSAIDEALSAFTVRKKEEAEQARLDAEFEAADRALIGEESKGRGGDISDPNRGKHILTEIEKFRLQEKQREHDLARKKAEEKARLLEVARTIANAKEEARREAEAAKDSKEKSGKDGKGETDGKDGGSDRPANDDHRRSRRGHSRSRSGSRHRHRRRSRSRSRSHHRSRKHSRRHRSRSSSAGSRDRHRRHRHRHDRHDRHSRRHRRRSSSRSRSRSPVKRSRRRDDDKGGKAEAPAAPVEPVKVSMSFKKKTTAARPVAAAPVAAAFAAAEDEDDIRARKRELIKLEFTEEERLAFVPAAAQGAAHKAAALAAMLASQASKGAVDVQAQIDNLPSQPAELFAYPIDWDTVDRRNIVDTVLKPVVAGAIEEYLGEVEPTIMEFVCGKLASHAPAQVLVDELQAVLDDDAPTFVAKIWRALAEAALKAKL